MAFKYPYGDTSQLNLDWILRAWREFQSQIENIIAPAYSNTQTYPANSLVIYDHVLWYNDEAITDPEEWTPEHWEKTTIAELFTS